MILASFFTTSVLATGVDWLLYAGFIHVLSPTVSNLISASAGLLTNFILQRNYVFNPSNSLYKSFVLSVLFSLCGLALGTGLIYLMTTYTPLSALPLIAKILTTAIIFFYNYFTKKIAFGHKDPGAHLSC